MVSSSLKITNRSIDEDNSPDDIIKKASKNENGEEKNLIKESFIVPYKEEESESFSDYLQNDEYEESLSNSSLKPRTDTIEEVMKSDENDYISESFEDTEQEEAGLSARKSDIEIKQKKEANNMESNRSYIVGQEEKVEENFKVDDFMDESESKNSDIYKMNEEQGDLDYEKEDSIPENIDFDDSDIGDLDDINLNRITMDISSRDIEGERKAVKDVKPIELVKEEPEETDGDEEEQRSGGDEEEEAQNAKGVKNEMVEREEEEVKKPPKKVSKEKLAMLEEFKAFSQSLNKQFNVFPEVEGKDSGQPGMNFGDEIDEESQNFIDQLKKFEDENNSGTIKTSNMDNIDTLNDQMVDDIVSEISCKPI